MITLKCSRACVFTHWSSQIKQWNLDEEQSEMLGDQLREIEKPISPLKTNLFLVKHNEPAQIASGTLVSIPTEIVSTYKSYKST